MTIWVFGCSLSTAFNVELDQCWPQIVAKSLGTSVNNFAHETVDNFFIYSSYINQKNNIKPDDITFLQWTTPFRKMFLYNKHNENHKRAMKEKPLTIKRNNKSYFRRINDCNATKLVDPDTTPRNSGIEFYDIWWNDYFDSYESETNLKAYQNATQDKNTVHLEFDKIMNIITDNQLYINKQDLHPSAAGHVLLANKILEKIYNTKIAEKKI